MVVALSACAAVAAPAFGHDAAHAGAAHAGAADAAHGGSRVQHATQKTTGSRGGAQAGLADLPLKRSRISCASLARTRSVSGLRVQIAQYEVGGATAGGPQYCALTGHIAGHIGFEILLPTETWHERYLQIGCGGLCGSIGLDAPESSNFTALADGYFVVASQDEGHSGQSPDWYRNPAQRVDFAYLSDHDLAKVAKGLAAKFYGLGPKYSYFDGCSQGGHQALTEAQRYPKDFNGILAGAPATIMTELNSILHEYEFDAVVSSSGQSILSETQAQIVLNAALKKCDAKVGLMLNYRGCEQTFKVSSVECSATKTSGCLTAAQVAAVRRVLAGPTDPQGEKLYPGGYSLASAWLWDNGTGPNIPATAGATVTPSTFITEWLQYFAFDRNIGTTGVADEPFTLAYFKKIEKLAPYWDDTDPYLGPFQKAGGKLILWQGTGDWSIPVDSSLAYYQAVVKAMGGLSQATQFTRYYQLPSVGHCGGGAPDTYAGLKSVVRWTETGKAPHALRAVQYQTKSTGGQQGPPSGTQATTDLTDEIPALGGRPAGTAVRSITLFPYPEVPVYRGHGSVDEASSFVGKVSRAVEKPLPWAGTFDTSMIWCNSRGVDCRARSMPKR